MFKIKKCNENILAQLEASEEEICNWDLETFLQKIKKFKGITVIRFGFQNDEQLGYAKYFNGEFVECDCDWDEEADGGRDIYSTLSKTKDITTKIKYHFYRKSQIKELSKDYHYPGKPSYLGDFIVEIYSNKYKVWDLENLAQ